MSREFFRLKTGKWTRIFAFLGIALFFVFRYIYFPVQGMAAFASHIAFKKNASGIPLSYPRATVVCVLAETKSVVSYAEIPGTADVQFSLFMGDLDGNDLKKNGVMGGMVMLYADCGKVPIPTLKKAQRLLEVSPFDEAAFEKLPLSRTQKAMLKLYFLDRPMRAFVIPREVYKLNQISFLLRMKGIWVTSLS